LRTNSYILKYVHCSNAPAKDSYNRKFTFSRYDAGFIHMLTGMFGLVVFVMKYVGPNFSVYRGGRKVNFLLFLSLAGPDRGKHISQFTTEAVQEIIDQ
jgi:hypothetical protein